MGEEWKRLARYLNVKSVRLQAIMRQNVNNEQDCIIYDMLLTWAKRVPRSMDKASRLDSGVTANVLHTRNPSAAIRTAVKHLALITMIFIYYNAVICRWMY